MKNLVVVLMVLSTFASCGKNNSANSGISGVSNPITTAVQGASSIGSMIDNYTTQFGLNQSSINYYITWGALANQSVNIGYHYTKDTTSASNNCTLKWGIINVCSSTSVPTSSVVESRKVNNNDIVILTKQNELKGYINNSYMITQNGSTSFLIYLKDGRKVVIDARYPLQAQPTGIMDSTGTEYLYNITEN
jgi:hypothetical protein